FTRGVAVGRALERAGFRGRYRMFGPRHPFTAAARDDWDAIVVRDSELVTREKALATDLAQRILAFEADILIVDMFWAPLRWILPISGCEAWLLLRSFPPGWLVGPPSFPFEASLFSRIVAIEPVRADVVTHTIDPVVVANPDEREPRGALRR